MRIQDVLLSGADDPTVLEWAANEGRLLLTHDVETITKYAFERIREGRPTPGVIEIRQDAHIQQAIEDILLLIECSFDNVWVGQVLYLPL